MFEWNNQKIFSGNNARIEIGLRIRFYEKKCVEKINDGLTIW